LYAPERRIIAAAILHTGVALVVHQDARNNLYLTGWRILWKNVTSRLIAYQTPLESPAVKKIGSSMPLFDYPSWISLVEQPDGSTYGIVSSTKHITGGRLMSQSSIFRLDDDQGLGKVNLSEGYWPFDQSSKWYFSK
jgi:hypothetical protein